jgi:myo-inositol 2-dehydrogenase/D-chiro-inositol 1-dehydrogenase
MSKPKLHIGIIGAGRIGAVHAATLAFRLPEAVPLVIADINRPAAEEVAARCGIPRVAESAEEVLADPDRGRGRRGQTHLLREAHRP